MSDNKDDSPLPPEFEESHLSPGGPRDNDASFVGSTPTSTFFKALRTNFKSNVPTSPEGARTDTSPNDLPLDSPKAQPRYPRYPDTEELTARRKATEIPDTPQSHGLERNLDPREDTPDGTSLNDLPLDIPQAQPDTLELEDTDEVANPSKDSVLPPPPQIQGSEQDVDSHSAAVDLAQQLGLINPLDLLSWTPDNFKKAQLEVVKQLKDQRSKSNNRNTTDPEAQISEIDDLLGEWEVTREASAELYPSWEDFEKERRRYKARVSELEAEVEELKAGKGPGEPPHPKTPFRGKDLEDAWLQKPCPATTEEWEQQVGTMFSDVLSREEELEKNRREVTNYKADLDHKESELLAYNQRVEDDVARVAGTANALLDMILYVRDGLKQAPNGHDWDGGGMRAANPVFKGTEELARRIAGQVEMAKMNMVRFWEGRRGRGVRAPWELIRAIKARDGKISGLEDEVRELKGKVRGFSRRMEKIQQAAEQISNTEDSQSVEGLKAFANQMKTLKHPVSDEVSESNDGTETEEYNSPPMRTSAKPDGRDDPGLLLDDEYGSVLKMADKFERMKAGLRGQIKNLQHLSHLTDRYKASRDQALKSLKESRDTCQQLRDKIESMKAESRRDMEDAMPDLYAQHTKELNKYRKGIDQSTEILAKREGEPSEKTKECEDLKRKIRDEKKKLLAYKMERFPRDDEMNPVVKRLLDQTSKEREELMEAKIEALRNSITGIEKTVYFEEKIAAHLNTVNPVPTLQGELDECRRELEAARSRIETLEYEIQREKDRELDFEREQDLLIAQLRSDLENQQEEADKMLADKKELEVEIANLRVEAARPRENPEDLFQQERFRDQDGEAVETKPSPFLKSALNQRISLLSQLRELRLKNRSIMSGRDAFEKQAKQSKDELGLVKASRQRLEDQLAAVSFEKDNLQAELSDLDKETRKLRTRAERMGYDENDPSKIWDNTLVRISSGFLESRIKALEEDLAKARKVGGASRGLKDDAENPDPAEIKSSSELFDTVKEIYGAPSTAGPTNFSLTRADMSNFWLHGALLHQRLALLRAIKDRDQKRGYEALVKLSNLLQETDLGPARDEAWGSVHYLHACFQLNVTRDLDAAEKAIQRAGEHHPERWTSSVYRVTGAKLKADLKADLESRIHAAAVGSS